jgi:UDP-N-acetylglucosamine--N-acetylmuramyl-(pentapeptide) pyrophosphoryl-undecaprenol N-acetylglucosamine transferase
MSEHGVKSLDRPRAAQRRRLRVCLAASGGGHVRQLLDLEPAWSVHDSYFVSEDTGLSRSLEARWPTDFVSHVALGQGRLGAPWRMMTSAIANFFQSAKSVWKRRPDVVVTTGAGSVFFTVLWARLLGAKVVVIESFARFEHMSAFARIAGPLAHERVLQSPALAPFWPKAPVFDPMRLLDGTRPEKEPLLFATVGATLPFDRLVAAVAAAKTAGAIPERVVIQSGVGGLKPEGLECHETLTFDEMIAMQRRADIVVCHGGTGSLITALREGCRVIAMPRLFSLGEHYDQHQAEITEAFAARGLISVANSEAELIEALEAVRRRTPVMATSDPAALNAHLAALLQRWAAARGRAAGGADPA